MLQVQKFTFNTFRENTYVISDRSSRACIIIDPGCSNQAEEQILTTYLQQQNLTPTQLLLTHAHIDHVLGLEFVCQTYKLTPYLHPDEKIILDHLLPTSRQYQIPVKAFTGKVQYLGEESVLQIGNIPIRVLFTPGHSPGSVSYLFGNQFLVCGDVLFFEGYGRVDLLMGDIDLLKASIIQKIFLLDEELSLYPGHGASSSITHEKKHNPIWSA